MNNITLSFLETNSKSVKEYRTYFEKNLGNSSLAVIFNDLIHSDSNEDKRSILRLIINISNTGRFDSLLVHQCVIHEKDMLSFSSSEDQKVRKNAYILYGRIHMDSFRDALVTSLGNETTMLAKESIYSSLCSYAKTNTEIEKLLRKELEGLDSESEDKFTRSIYTILMKHFSSKERYIRKKISDNAVIDRQIMFRCSNARITKAELEEKGIRSQVLDANENILITGKNIKISEIYKNRTFYEYLVVMGNDDNIDSLLRKTKRKDIIDVLKKLFGEGNYRFYVDVQGYGIENKERISVQKKVTELFSSPELTNDVSDYDAEFRIVRAAHSFYFTVIPNKDNDTRFSYRKRALSASIHPSVAASVVYASRNYFKNKAAVLDPFCGSGTMLFERSYYPSGTLKGSDISKNALDAFKDNILESGKKIRAFRHDASDIFTEQYDEVISNMPFGLRVSNHSSNLKLYKGFYENLKVLLKKNGYAFLFTNEKKLLREILDEEFEIIDTLRFSAGGLFPSLFILKKV